MDDKKRDIVNLSEDKIPYVCFKIPNEFLEKIHLLEPEWYETDGTRIFPSKGKNGKYENVAFILFKVPS